MTQYAFLELATAYLQCIGIILTEVLCFLVMYILYGMPIKNISILESEIDTIRYVISISKDIINVTI